MKIITFSDLHLEFGTDFMPPKDSDADLMILAGDICLFNDISPMERFLDGWTKPVLYIAGNHEYYNAGPMDMARKQAVERLAESNPNVRFLHDEAVEIGGAQFFGGTMWTWFDNQDRAAMAAAQWYMNDYRLITDDDGSALSPERTVVMHEEFMAKLLAWFDNGVALPRVVITHHAPVLNPKTKYKKSVLVPAYVSLDMAEIIKKYQPALVIHGHTHECDRQKIGKTLVLSNQRGYPRPKDLCGGFDPDGAPVEL